MRVPFSLRWRSRVGDGAVAVAPDVAFLLQGVRQPLADQDLRMHAHDQHLLVIGAVEDADAPALGQVPRRPPQEVVVQLLGAGVLEAEHLAALRVDAGHHVPDRPVLAGGVHGLEDQQHGVPVAGIEHLLLLAELADGVLQQLLVVVLGLVEPVDPRRPLVEIDLVSLSNLKVLRLDLHDVIRLSVWNGPSPLSRARVHVIASLGVASGQGGGRLGRAAPGDAGRLAYRGTGRRGA